MKSADRTILAGLALAGLVAAFWFLILSPQRKEASKLGAEVIELQVTVAEAELAATAGAEAKSGFAGNYRKLVSLGKAVPKDADTSSLLVQLETLSGRSRVDFRSISLEASATGSASAPPAAPAPAPTDPGVPAESAADPAAPADSAATPAGATTPGAVPSESTAALLPIGATVGTAGLPVMPYSLEFEGGFFEIADFFGRLDSMVDAGKSGVRVDGRLLTIDGFNLTAGGGGFPNLTATMQASSYLTPADQGIVAGATPGGPAAPADPMAPATSGLAAPAAPASAVVTP